MELSISAKVKVCINDNLKILCDNECCFYIKDLHVCNLFDKLLESVVDIGPSIVCKRCSECIFSEVSNQVK